MMFLLQLMSLVLQNTMLRIIEIYGGAVLISLRIRLLFYPDIKKILMQTCRLSMHNNFYFINQDELEICYHHIYRWI